MADRLNPDTPLGREFARLSSWENEAPALTTLAARRTVKAEALAEWDVRVSRARQPLGPADLHANPVRRGDTLFCVEFSPGTVYALDASTGERRWKRKLGYLAGSTVVAPPDVPLVYVATSRILRALEPASGRVAWQFEPYPEDGEWIYSTPEVADGRLFVGDREGYLHCLDALTGRPIWRVLTSRAENRDVNSGPVAFGSTVAVATNAKMLGVYDASTGGELWRVRLDGACTHLIRSAADEVLLWTWHTASRIGLADASLRGRWRRRNFHVEQACAAGDLTLLVVRREWPGPDLWPVSELWAYRGDERVYVSTYPRAAMATLHYAPATGLVYEPTTYGLGILDPATGERRAVVSEFGGRQGFHLMNPPWVDASGLFVFDDGGRLHHLRHPEAHP